MLRPPAVSCAVGVLLACRLALPGEAVAATGCRLVVQEHRSGRLLAQWPVAAPPVRFTVSFIHSVLGTPVQDHYEMRANAGRMVAHLVQEDFVGEGYGLPHAADPPGETLERHGAGWRLRLDRVVDPLVQRPLPAQQVRLHWEGGSVRLADLSPHAQRIELLGC